MATVPKLTLQDHAMIHALHMLAMGPWTVTSNEEGSILSILRDVLPGVSRGNPLLAPLAEQADRVLRTRGPVASLRHEIEAACYQFNRLRFAAAWANITGDGR